MPTGKGQREKLLESVICAELFEAIPNAPYALAAAQQVVDEMPALLRWSDGRLEGVCSRYAAHAKTFNWISLYRTLLAATVHSRGKRPNVRHGCQQLLKLIDLDVNQLRDHIRDTLLTMWRDWHWMYKGQQLPRGAERHLQQDIKRAVDFVATVTGEPTNYRDSRWYISDRNPRRWAQLHEALPYEHWIAQETFAPHAAMYLEKARLIRFRKPVPTTAEELKKALEGRWPVSYGFRRFTLLFKRLHDLLNKDADALVTFTDHNVIDYMILSCLVVERMVAEWWRSRNPGAAELPTLDAMLESLAAELSRVMTCTSIDVLLRRHRKAAKLHALKVGGRLPLITPTSRTPRQFIFTTLHNLRVMRNYSAHHDCLDYELSFSREGAKAMRTIVSAVALLLTVPV